MLIDLRSTKAGDTVFVVSILMNPSGRFWLLLGASISFAIALLHVVIVFIGPAAYSFFGGARLAQLAASGSSSPAVMTLSLALVHFVFGVYGLSGAGLIRRLHFLSIGLLIIGGLYAFRGLSFINQTLQIVTDPGSLPLRVLFYSLVSLTTGCAYIMGTVKSAGWLRERKDQKSERFSA